MNTFESQLKNGEIKKHHTSYTKGYVSRKSEGIVRPYKGRFGEGFVKLTPNWDSTNYCYITYYV